MEGGTGSIENRRRRNGDSESERDGGTERDSELGFTICVSEISYECYVFFSSSISQTKKNNRF
jgi:hypothetical protein